MWPVLKADNLTTFMCRFSWNLRASNSWNTIGFSRPVMGLLYLLLSGKTLKVIAVETVIIRIHVETEPVLWGFVIRCELISVFFFFAGCVLSAYNCLILFDSVVLLTLHMKVLGIVDCHLSPILFTRVLFICIVDSQYFTYRQFNIMCSLSFSNYVLEVLISVFSILSLSLPSCICMYICLYVYVTIL
jgi:hypothetical protein